MSLNINQHFKPSTFNKSPVDDILLAPEGKLVLLIPEKKLDIYKTFYENLNLFLTKLPSNNVKTQIQNLANKKLIYLAVTNLDYSQIFSRVLLTKSKDLAGIALNSLSLGVDVNTGETDRIDDCVYASYFSFCRAAVLANKEKITNNKKLHKLLSTYIYLITIKSLGKNTLYSKKQKQLIHMCSIYMYYVYFFNKTHSYAISIINRDYSDIIDKDIYEEFKELMKDRKGYEKLKDLPALLYDLKLSFKEPKLVYVSLFKILGKYGFYCFIGPFDHFVSAMITTKYPSSLFNRSGITNEKIHNSVEKIFVDYMNKVKFKTIFKW